MKLSAHSQEIIGNALSDMQKRRDLDKYLNLTDPYARLRGRTVRILVAPRANAQHCPQCHKSMRNGVCPECGWCTICKCGKIRQADGAWRYTYAPQRDLVHRSHAFCPVCFDTYHKAAPDALKAAKARRRAGVVYA